MNSKMRFLIACAVATFGVGGPYVAFASHPAADSALGTPLHQGTPDRVVTIGTDAKWVNVRYDEAVKFVVPGSTGAEKSFMWRFDTLNRSVIDLHQVAPAGLLEGRAVRAYISPNVDKYSQ